MGPATFVLYIVSLLFGRLGTLLSVKKDNNHTRANKAFRVFISYEGKGIGYEYSRVTCYPSSNVSCCSNYTPSDLRYTLEGAPYLVAETQQLFSNWSHL